MDCRDITDEELIQIVISQKTGDPDLQEMPEIMDHISSCPVCQQRLQHWQNEMGDYEPWDPEKDPEIPLPDWMKEQLAEMRRRRTQGKH